MGQENEERAELIATVQHDHVPMKTWYNQHPDARALHGKYGPDYPSFWREVVTWDGWKAARKLYLKSIEVNGKDKDRTKDQIKIEAGAGPGGNGSGSGSGTGTARKRRSRWGGGGSTDGTSNSTSPPKRKSRWARGRDPTPVAPSAASMPTTSVLDLLPGLPTNLTSSQSLELSFLQKTLRECNAKLTNLEVEAARVDKLPNGHRERSPSPPPIYGIDGKRSNTRAVRWRERFTSLRQDSLEKILKLTTGGNASRAVSVAPSLFNRKRTKKIYIPVEEHPTYNFIGLIIGPRGKTQKEMEGKTGCKIAIRGKGSVKEGARGRRDGKIMEGDNEPLHVVVTGDNQDNVNLAAKMVQDMLVVIDDDKNIHKQAQLRELALLNGTLKEDEYCSLCAEKGHRAFECPKRFSMNKPGAIEVRCAICGDTSHPTRDCKMKEGASGDASGNGLLGGKTPENKELDSDYLAFMNELDGKPADAAATVTRPRTSLVTTIINGKSVGGLPPTCQVVTSITPNVKASETVNRSASANAASAFNIKPPASGGSLITTISSRVVKTPAIPVGVVSQVMPVAVSDVHSSMNGPTTVTSISGVPNGSPPKIAHPSASPSGPPPPPPSTISNVGTAVLPNNGAIPPPPGLPPGGVPQPPLPGSYGGAYGQQTQQQQQQYPQQQQYSGYHQQQNPQYGYQQQQQQQQQQRNNNYHQGNVQGYPGQGHGQGGYHQQAQNNNGNGAGAQQGGWDYRSYYGNENGSGNNNNTSNSNNNSSGAGGFNWWES
uniref:Branchpoint-bridging protein n=1 Tax=Chaetoceros debilis TaxID=122233 RepID=A0A7S3QBF5_9STRA